MSNKEIEAKVINISIPDTVKKIQDIGGKLVHGQTTLIRMVYEIPGFHPTQRRARLRQEDNGLYMVVKIVTDPTSPSGTEELETKTDMPWDKACLFMEGMGLKPVSKQENYRIKYKVGDVTCDIDRWPGLKPHLEVEGPSEEDIFRVFEQLGFKREDTMVGPVADVYLKVLGIPTDVTWKSNLTFANPPTKWMG